MASRTEKFEIHEIQGIRRSRTRGGATEKGTRTGGKKRVAMVPARFFSGTPEFAKGVVGRWGKMISFEDGRPFFF